MTEKIISTIITVILGVGAALLLYWILDKLAEILPDKWEHRIKPYLYILPAYVAIVFYLVYPAVQTVVFSFKDSSSTAWVGLDNFNNLLKTNAFQQTLFNTLLWMIVVPIATVIL